MNFWSRLSGHKNQIMSIITLIMGYLLSNGYVDKELSNLILGICAALLAVTIGDGIRKRGLLKKK